jgi:biopolymer transport protein ExbB
MVQTLFNATLVGAEWVLWLLLGLSLVSVAIILQRGLVFFLNRRADPGLSARLDAALLRDDLDAARAVLEKHARSVEARVSLAALDSAHLGVGAVEEKVIAARNTERARLERHVSVLGTIGSNAPFIGLFGTVLGIIRAFHDLSLGSKEGAAAVMAGISEALVATAVGLMVAIPAVVAFNVFKRMVQARLQSADTLTRSIFAHLKADPDSGAAPPAEAKELVAESAEPSMPLARHSKVEI